MTAFDAPLSQKASVSARRAPSSSTCRSTPPKLAGTPRCQIIAILNSGSLRADPAIEPAPAAALQSEVLKPAAEAMRAMPDFDAARVAELRDALARGELPFDPGRLAGLIQKFHGGR